MTITPATTRASTDLTHTRQTGTATLRSESPEPTPPARSVEPSPYELYIRLEALEAVFRLPDGALDWPGRPIACCGLSAAELTLRLIDEALSDPRGTDLIEQRVERLLEHLLRGLETTCRLLERTPPPIMVLQGALTRSAVHSPGFTLLPRLTCAQVERISELVERATRTLPFQLGIEPALSAARSAHGLAPLASWEDDTRPALDYEALVQPTTLWNLREPTPFGLEDHLFSTAHQISECWLAITHHLLAQALADAQKREFADAAHAIVEAAKVLKVVSEAGQLLDMMVLADYHPLRVRLRDGSGAQSRAAQALPSVADRAASLLWSELAARGMDTLDVLEHPVRYPAHHRYLSALKALGRQVQSFLFQHYLLALSVLGTYSIGSLGYGIHKLGERATKPIFPRIDRAHHDYVMLTNFRHGESSGAIILQNERAAGWDPYHPELATVPCPVAAIERAVASYFHCIEARDAAGWVKLFDPAHGQLHDIPGSRPYHGKVRLGLFINAMFNAFSQMKGRFHDLRIEDNRASVAWQFDATSYDGRATTFTGREEFVFDAQGVILHATAHWTPADVAAAWERMRLSDLRTLTDRPSE